jgi:uncharacterized protein (TIGR02646 family)
MRPIQKRVEPDRLTQWKASGNEDWQPPYPDLRGDLKRHVHTTLAAEQGWVCCYCERRIAAVPGTSHIEHLRPQCPDPDSAEAPPDPLGYGNMLCSCDTNGQHCGMKKGNSFLPIHPLQPDCTSHLEFGSSGAIAPRADDPLAAAARQTIAVLGLDGMALRTRRRDAWGALVEQLREAPANGAQALVPLLMAKDADGRHLPHAAALAALLAALSAGP